MRRLNWKRESVDRLFRLNHATRLEQFDAAFRASRSRANDIVLGRRGITADTAMRFGSYFGTSPEFWINLQGRHDLDVANRTL
jgi:addiction module HigA family antidote